MSALTPSEHPRDSTPARFADDVRQGLRGHPRQLPSRYFYDPLGSALFDAICHLPWYRITRAESRLLAAHAHDVLQRFEPVSRIVELGPGSGGKLKLLLDERRNAAPLELHLVDVSTSALALAAQALDGFPNVRIATHAAEYTAGLRDAAAGTRPDRGGRTLVLFLGSNIGNFDPPCAADFLAEIRDCLAEGDAFLLGADLVKPEQELLLAYDDPLGVTAAFNRNLLVRINRELGANFNIGEFDHQAVWNPGDSRVEMHLVARSAQQVQISALSMEFALEAGERIWTESSYKYRPSDVEQMLRAARFDPVAPWIDGDSGFMLTLAEAAT